VPAQFEDASAQALLPAGAPCERYRPLLGDNSSCLRDHYHDNDTVRCDSFLYQNIDTVFVEVSS
jgi:hypothetical protein